MGLLDLKINRRNFIKYFTGGLFGAGLVPMVDGYAEIKRTDGDRPWKGDEWWLREDHSQGKFSDALIEDARKSNIELIKAIFDLT